MTKWLWISLVIIALDQLTKYFASAHLVLHQPVEVLPVFNLTLMHNSGAAFSFLHDAGGWQRWFFTVLALVVSGLIIAWMRKLTRQERWLAVSYALILGGAIGNVIDRLQHGYVVDFIQVYYNTSYFPTFNIADSAITVGAIMMIIDVFFLQGKRNEVNKNG